MEPAVLTASDAVAALSALAQETRLSVFRTLLARGSLGLPAGEIARTVGVAPNTLSFHLTHLHYAGLVTSCREGRQITYIADGEQYSALLAFLAGGLQVAAVTPKPRRKVTTKSLRPREKARQRRSGTPQPALKAASDQ